MKERKNNLNIQKKAKKTLILIWPKIQESKQWKRNILRYFQKLVPKLSKPVVTSQKISTRVSRYKTQS